MRWQVLSGLEGATSVLGASVKESRTDPEQSSSDEGPAICATAAWRWHGLEMTPLKEMN